jgi:hypothetical protein
MRQTILRAHEARAPLFTAICVVVGLMAFGSQAKAADISGNATLTTDYVWRGSTQTRGDPAVHATDNNAKAIFGDDYAGSRVEAALQASF